MNPFLPPFRSLHPALRAIILLNAAVFALCAFERTLGLRVFASLALFPRWAGDRPWTLLTYAFVHANFVHVALNMLMLWSFGDDVARTLGGRRFVLFYLAAALVAGGASVFFYQGSVVGASGALLGVMYLYGALYPDRRMLFFWLIPMRMGWGVWVIAALDLLATNTGDGVAHWAHLGGFAAGIVYARLFLRSRLRPSVFSRLAAKLRSRGAAAEPIDLDALLRKISERGIDSLTPGERAALLAESERRRREKEEYQRWR